MQYLFFLVLYLRRLGEKSCIAGIVRLIGVGDLQKKGKIKCRHLVTADILLSFNTNPEHQTSKRQVGGKNKRKGAIKKYIHSLLYSNS